MNNESLTRPLAVISRKEAVSLDGASSFESIVTAPILPPCMHRNQGGFPPPTDIKHVQWGTNMLTTFDTV